MQSPSPPPPPPPKGAFFNANGSGTLSLSSSSSPSPKKSSSDDFYTFCSMEEETPLIGSRKKQGYVVGNKTSIAGTYGSGNLQAMMPTSSSIPEVPLTSTSTVNSQEDDDNDNKNDNENHDNDNDDDLLSVSTTSSSAVSIASFSTVSSLAENFKESLLLPFTDEDGTNVGRGLLALAVIGTLLGILLQAVAQAQQFHNKTTTTTNSLSSFICLDYISSICGYNYLILWSVCFYPQAIQNYRKQSTHGVSHDFGLLNLMGWTFYSIYMSSLYFLPDIRQLYKERFHESSTTVALNDVLFATHAMCLALVYVFQILYYSNKPKRRATGKRQRQQAQKSSTNSKSSSRSITTVFHCPISSMPKLKLKKMTKVLVAGMIVPTIILPAIISSNVSTIHSITWLDYLYMLSYFKICCTLTKYTKQVYFNYKRSSTKGWNIWYNFLEASGGTLSMIQLVLDAYILGDVVSGITGNMAKFLLGFATIAFDAIFFMQHYVWYYVPPADRDDDERDGDDNVNNDGAAVPSKRIPKHLRANSRFEIAIFPTSPVHGHGQCHDEYGTDNNHNSNNNNLTLSAVKESDNEKRPIHRATSEISLASSTTNRSNEYIGRL